LILIFLENKKGEGFLKKAHPTPFFEIPSLVNGDFYITAILYPNKSRIMVNSDYGKYSAFKQFL